MNSNATDDILKRLEELENQGNLSDVSENYIQDLKIQFKFIKIFVRWAMVQGRKFGYTYFFKDIQEVVNAAALDLSQTTSDGKTMDEMIFGMLEIIGWLDVSMNSSRRYYVCCQQNIPITDEDVEYIHEHMLELINPLLENLKYLLSSRKVNLLVLLEGHVIKLEKQLTFLRNFLKIAEKITESTVKQEMQNRLRNVMTHLEVLIGDAAVVSYFCWQECLQEEIHVKNKLSDLISHIKHIEPEIKMIYVEVLKDSI